VDLWVLLFRDIAGIKPGTALRANQKIEEARKRFEF
jgi:hypothetical protein